MLLYNWYEFWCPAHFISVTTEISWEIKVCPNSSTFLIDILSFLISDTSNKCFLKIRWTPHLISSVWDELFVQATISMCACHVMSPISQSSPCFPYSEYSIRPMLIDFPIWVLYVVMLLYRTIHSSIFKNAAFCLATCPHIDCWSNFQFKI